MEEQSLLVVCYLPLDTVLKFKSFQLTKGREHSVQHCTPRTKQHGRGLDLEVAGNITIEVRVCINVLTPNVRYTGVSNT